MKKYSFYRNGELVYICYTKAKSDEYKSDLEKRCIEFELKIEQMF